MKEHIYMTIEDQTFKVLHYEHESSQDLDVYGKSKGKSDGGVFDITIEFDANPMLRQWAMSDALTKDVTITVPSRYGVSKSIEIQLSNVLCVGCKDVLNTLDKEHYTRRIRLSAAKMKFSGEDVFERYWNQ